MPVRTHLPSATLAPVCRVLAKKAGSAIDVVQELAGCALGIGHLILHEYSKHVNAFMYNEAEGLRLVLKPDALHVIPKLLTLDEKIEAGWAIML